MSRGEDLALAAMKKEFATLSRKADKAKREADECTNIGTELFAIHQEFAAIVKSGETPKAMIANLNALKKRSERAEKIRKKDLLKLFDKEHKAAMDRDAMAGEIQGVEFRQSIRAH